MQIEARFRRRAIIAGENISDLNSRLLVRLSKIEGLWMGGQSVTDAYFDMGTGESAATDISPCLISGIKGAFSFASRLPAAIVDKAISDDSITLKFDSDAIDFQWFGNEIFPEIIKAFSPYRAAIVTDLEQDLDDYEDIVEESRCTGHDVDGRDTVFRFYPVNYFDNSLCIRAFGISSDEVVAKLEKSIKHAANIDSGALLLVAESPVVGDDLIVLDGSIRQKLGIRINRIINGHAR